LHLGGPPLSASIVARSETSFTVQVEIPYGSSMLDFEQTIQERLNQAGVVATQEALQQFDTDGSPITVGPIKFTSKGQLPKEYQTPYGVATVARHVYQSSQGGKTYCPLDRDARIVVSSTPTVRQDDRPQVRRVRLGTGPHRPAGESRPEGGPVVHPERRRCGRRRRPGQGEDEGSKVGRYFYETMKGRESLLREYAVEGLWRSRSPRAVEPLIKALSDRAGDVRHKAVRAICGLGDERALEPLKKMLAAKSNANRRGIREYAEMAIAKIEARRRARQARGKSRQTPEA
jgi:hypothetical protein